MIWVELERGKYGAEFYFPREARGAAFPVIIKGSIHLSLDKTVFLSFNHVVKISPILHCSMDLVSYSLLSLVFHTFLCNQTKEYQSKIEFFSEKLFSRKTTFNQRYLFPSKHTHSLPNTIVVASEISTSKKEHHLDFFSFSILYI